LLGGSNVLISFRYTGWFTEITTDNKGTIVSSSIFSGPPWSRQIIQNI